MEDERQCVSTAYALLARQMRTKQNLKSKLMEKGYPVDTVAKVMSALEEARLVDDVIFAENYILAHRAQHGEFRMRRTLSQKGVSDEDFNTALHRVEAEEEPFEKNHAIDLLVRKKCDQIGIDFTKFEADFAYRQKIAAKLMRFLAGRGFGADEIRKSLSRVLAQDTFYES